MMSLENFFEALPWDIEMYMLRFCNTQTSMHFCLTDKRRSEMSEYVAVQHAIEEFEKVIITLRQFEGLYALQRAREEYSQAWDLAFHILKLDEGEETQSLRRVLGRELKLKGALRVGMETKHQNDCIRKIIDVLNALVRSAENFDEEAYADFITKAKQDIKLANQLIEQNLKALSQAK